jgi:hypothetical protein
VATAFASLRRLAGRVRPGPRYLPLALAALLLTLSFALPQPAVAAPSDISTSLIDQLVHSWFPKFEGRFTMNLITWLTQIPNFDPGALHPLTAGAARTHIDVALTVTTMVALGGLGAVSTLSVARYWIAGLSTRGSGGIEAVEGLSRTLLAVALILLWADRLARVHQPRQQRDVRDALSAPSVHSDIEGVWGWTTLIALDTGPGAPIIGMLVYIMFVLAIVALVMMKVMITAGARGAVRRHAAGARPVAAAGDRMAGRGPPGARSWSA